MIIASDVLATCSTPAVAVLGNVAATRLHSAVLIDFTFPISTLLFVHFPDKLYGMTQSYKK